MRTYSSQTRWLARLAGVVTIGIVSFVMLTIVDSVYQEPPYAEIRSTVKHIKSDTHDVLVVHRMFKRLNNNDATLISELRSRDVNTALHLPDTTINHETAFYTALLLPHEYRGLWCIDSELRYNYRLSVARHKIELAELCVDLK
jgi:hypothetical protein